jgi:hypothetical protein
MTKLRLAGVLTAIALLVGLLGTAVTVSAQGATVITGDVTFSGAAAPAGTQVRVVDADGSVVASSMTGRDGFAANGYRIDISLSSGDPLSGATVSLQALTGEGTLDGPSWAPGVGAVTVQVIANSVITQDIETDTAPPGEGITVTKEQIEAIVQAYVDANRASLRGPGGARGSAGAAGPAGPAGVAGPAGSDGDQGGAGPPGPRGATGGQGPQGPQGEVGAAGANGANGVAGPRGPTGNAGPQGPQGTQGGQGGQGEVGPAGSNGAAGEDGGTALAVIALIIAIVAAIAAGAGVMMAQKK